MPRPGDPKGKPISFSIFAEGDQLLMQPNGAGPKIPLAAQSATIFSAFGGTIEFATDEHGAVTRFTARAVEGDFKVIRKGDIGSRR